LEQLHYLLNKHWNVDTFRDQQAEIVNSLLNNQNVIVLMPTGGGKSLCYQLPAVFLKGTAIVVSPLISLMQDQVEQLNQKGIPAAFLSQNQSKEEQLEIFDSAKSGALKLLYVSPERLISTRFLDEIDSININVIAIDEAHCISQWGHDFRPEYLSIKSFIEFVNCTKVIALTASATPEVLAEIKEQLNFNNATIYKSSFAKPNIAISIHKMDNKFGSILSFLNRNSDTSSIVYCRSRNKTEQVAQFLLQNGITTQAYHAGLANSKRKEIQQQWSENVFKVIVATNAFGMGINKSDVRNVIHFEPPQNLEAYYQEIGRGGRDGAPSKAITFYNQYDIDHSYIVLENAYPSDAYLRHIYQCVCNYLQIPAGVEINDYYPFNMEEFVFNFKLEFAQASAALKLLAQQGLWSITEKVYQPERVHVLATNHEIEAINKYMIGQVLVALLRLYSGLHYGLRTINSFQIARLLNLKKEDVISSLNVLNQRGFIRYIPTSKLPRIHIHHFRVFSEQLIINKKRIEKLKKSHLKKLDALYNCFSSSICYQLNVLHYFGELTAKPCGICDNCIKQKKDNIKVEELILSILQTQKTMRLSSLIHELNLPSAIITPIVKKLIHQNKIDFNSQTLIISLL
jgi:ATP-dependent DNA helicase RecQ